MKIRSFLAFNISDEMKGEIAQIIAFLSSKVRDIRWVDPKLMHCTIRFFGDVEEELLMGDLAQVIESEVRHQSPISLIGRGVGVFPNWRYPRVLWAGLYGETESVVSLHAKLEEAFERFGFMKDKRILRVHLTLGRSRTKFKDTEHLMQIVEKLGEKEFGKIIIDHLTLYKSTLTRDGPIYTALKDFPLGGGKQRKK